VAERNAGVGMAPWLEMELARQLSPVAAPESLWDRIHVEHVQPVPRRAGGFRWELWPAAAALLLLASGGVIWQAGARDPVADMEKLATQELHQFHGLDIRSEDPAEIQTWLKANANIDIALPGSGAVRLLGARLIPRRGAPVAAVAYRVGDNDATLLVSKKHWVFSGKAASKHVFSRIESAGGARFFSWRTREHVYTIASSMTKDPQAPCLLCHANEPPPTTLN